MTARRSYGKMASGKRLQKRCRNTTARKWLLKKLLRENSCSKGPMEKIANFIEHIMRNIKNIKWLQEHDSSKGIWKKWLRGNCCEKMAMGKTAPERWLQEHGCKKMAAETWPQEGPMGKWHQENFPRNWNKHDCKKMVAEEWLQDPIW